VYLACSQQSDGGFAQNFWIDGTPYRQGIQLDEVAFPILLAWHMWKKNALRDFNPYPMIHSPAAYFIQHDPARPATQQERWEEDCGYSPSTLAVSIAALVCPADLAGARGNQEGADFLTVGSMGMGRSLKVTFFGAGSSRLERERRCWSTESFGENEVEWHARFDQHFQHR
jgi:GH15 family glucan-1,4-alpha-glucosidase